MDEGETQMSQAQLLAFAKDISTRGSFAMRGGDPLAPTLADFKYSEIILLARAYISLAAHGRPQGGE